MSSSQVNFISENVSFEGYLKKMDDITQLKKLIIDKVKEILTEKINIKHNIELLLYITKMIQNLVSNKGKVEKIDKKQLAIDILKGIFPDFSKQDEEIASGLIQGLYDRGLIKRISYLKKKSIAAFALLKKYAI